MRTFKNWTRNSFYKFSGRQGGCASSQRGMPVCELSRLVARPPGNGWLGVGGFG